MERKGSHDREVEKKRNQRGDYIEKKSRRCDKVIEKTRRHRGSRKVRFSESSPSEGLILNTKVVRERYMFSWQEDG